MHRSQRDDLRLPAQRGLGPYRRVDRRLDVVGVIDATVFRASGELPPSADLPLAGAAGHQPDASRLEGMVAGRNGDPARGAHRSTPPPRRHRGGAGGDPRRAEFLAAHPLVPARRLRSERLAPGPRQRRRHPLPSAHDRSSSPVRHARARARCGETISRIAHHQSGHAGDARAARRRPAGVRRRVSGRARDSIVRICRRTRGRASRAPSTRRAK